MKKPKIHEAAIDLLTKFFSTHKVGLPEWLKNAREAYLRIGVEKREDRKVIIHHHRPTRKKAHEYLEVIDFAGIRAQDIEDKFNEWAKPDAVGGLKLGEAEGGQGNGGKGYLREMFDTGFFASIKDGKLSVVSFVDAAKHILDFVPDEVTGKDNPSSNPAYKDLRDYADMWCEAVGLPKGHNITIIRGIGPKKALDPDRLLTDIQQSPQARQSIDACVVDFYNDRVFRRELKVVPPELHPAFPAPIHIEVPPVITLPDGTKVHTCRDPEFPQGEVELCIAANPLQGAMASWNRVDFFVGAARNIGYERSESLPLEQVTMSKHLFGRCRLPLLRDPKDDYEMQARVRIKDGPLRDALYHFIAQEADKRLAQLAKLAAGAVQHKKQKDLEDLHKRLAEWIEAKMADFVGLSETGDGVGDGKQKRKHPTKKAHPPAAEIKIHRDKLDVCKGVSYPLRVLAYASDGTPVPAGHVVWKSSNAAIASVHPERGDLRAVADGMATITATSASGLTTPPMLVTVHEAAEITIKGTPPVKVGSNRRVQLLTAIKKTNGKGAPKDTVVGWKSENPRIATVSADGYLVGGELGDTTVTAHADAAESAPMSVTVEYGAAGKPSGGGQGKPRIFLSGVHDCPFGFPNILNPTDPPVHQRPGTPDYASNVFWINLQHPLAERLFSFGTASVQWRAYHVRCLVDAYTIIVLRSQYGGQADLDVDLVIAELMAKMALIFQDLKDQMFDMVFVEPANAGAKPSKAAPQPATPNTAAPVAT